MSLQPKYNLTNACSERYQHPRNDSKTSPAAEVMPFGGFVFYKVRRISYDS